MVIQHTSQQYDFLDGSLKPLENPLYRIQQGNKRYYYRYVGDEVIIYTSGTTAVSDGYVPTSAETQALNDWKLKMILKGEDPIEYFNYRADYGTLMHLLWGDYLKGKVIPTDPVSFVSYLRNMDEVSFSNHRLEEIIRKDAEEQLRDLMCFVRWVQTYDVKPLAIELMVCSDELLIGTPVDLLCTMINPKMIYKSGNKKNQKKPKAEESRLTAIVDFKSGRVGHYPKHAVQLLISRAILAHSHPHVKVDRLYNISPKAWRNEPEMRMTDQTNPAMMGELPEILSIAKKRHLKRDKVIKTYEGSFKLGDNQNVFMKMSLEEFLKIRRDVKTANTKLR